ncbi:MAG: hypothetical protein JJ921_08480 [Pseudomonadales bacterium]|nr:hypothetical protein [Pseudomonadales bacterium]MBO6598027.1 hypothetical protein [Pseudomonadales bacterium]MBO6702365.1 hypothetical protein [Pseudomonadales bacterium]MBO6824547.1 hypothetical protein [Pseudomonadales bacterium]MBO7007298.1 hypothetical protein [Pseudomonadales bacterium]
MKIREIVKDQNAHFVFYRDRALFYETDNGFQFPVPIEDAGSATFNKEEKAILLMRYIRRHLKNVEEAKDAQADSDA